MSQITEGAPRATPRPPEPLQVLGKIKTLVEQLQRDEDLAYAESLLARRRQELKDSASVSQGSVE